MSREVCAHNIELLQACPECEKAQDEAIANEPKNELKEDCMSVITDILVLTPLEDFGSIEMNEKMKAAGWPTLKKISAEASRSSAMQAEVWATAINYFNEKWFIEMLNSVEWEYRGDIQVMMKCEYDDTFTLYTLSR